MSQNNKRFLVSIIRRVIFAGLVILGAWLLLFALRGAIPDSVINLMNEEISGSLRNHQSLSLDSRSWDWSLSIFQGKPVSELLRGRLGLTLQFIALSGLLSLVIAAALLFLGFLIGHATGRPVWLARLRSILRLVLVSRGVSIPFFAVSLLIVVFSLPRLSTPNPSSQAMMFWTALFASLWPAWLLVQAGHGEMSYRQSLPRLALARHMSVYLFIRLLNLIGVIFVIGIVFWAGAGEGN